MNKSPWKRGGIAALEDYQLQTAYDLLTGLAEPTDADADHLEMIVDERMHRQGRPSGDRDAQLAAEEDHELVSIGDVGL